QSVLVTAQEGRKWARKLIILFPKSGIHSPKAPGIPTLTLMALYLIADSEPREVKNRTIPGLEADLGCFFTDFCAYLRNGEFLPPRTRLRAVLAASACLILPVSRPAWTNPNPRNGPLRRGASTTTF